jgi:Winged helix DNA-binding domain
VAERVLTQRDLNRALLARQLLFERARIPLTRALEHVGGIQMQYAPSAYIGLWSRLGGFKRDDLTRALEQRRVVQGTLMRVTIHLVSRRDYWPLAIAVRQPRRDWWLRVHARDGDPDASGKAASRLRQLLAEGPRREAELMESLPRDAWNGAGLWLDIVRVPPSGTWERRRADIYAAAADWIGPPDIDEDDAREHIVRRYLGAFGPARRAEIADWAGIPVTTLAPTFERMTLRRFRDEQGKELLDLPRAPLPDPETPAPVRFLPTWDATLLVHARRTQILPERYRPRIFNTKTPNSASTFLVDGAVAGTWRHDEGRITLEPFERLSRSVRRELDDEAERLAAFHS